MTTHEAAERPVPSLSERQREVLERLLTGATNKEIAADIGVSEQCVKYHLTQLFHKFHVDTRVALALAVNGIIGGG